MIKNYLKNLIIQTHDKYINESDIDAGSLLVTGDYYLAMKVIQQGHAALPVVKSFDTLDEFTEKTGFSFSQVCTDINEIDSEYFERVYRRFYDIPWDITETKRCYIRESTVRDVDAFYEIYSEPSITEFMESLYPLAEEREYIRKYIDNAYHFFGFGIWTVVEKTSGRIIGRAGLDMRDGEVDAELGFVIAKEYQGIGIATEVCQSIIEYGFNELEMPRIQAFVQKGNTASTHLLEKLGFIKEGTKLIDGEYHLRFVKQK